MSEKKNTKQETDINQKVGKPEDIVSGQQVKNMTPGPVIYLGPPISGVSMPGTVYQNGLTPQMQKIKEEVPAFGKLLITVGNVTQVRRELQDPQSALSICYQKVVEHVKKGAEG